MSQWSDAQQEEFKFHDLLRHNFYLENTKQLKIYAPRMKLSVNPWFNIDFDNKSVIDVGGGWDSILLKGVNLKNALVIDPLIEKAPNWIKERYKDANINYESGKAETMIAQSPKWDMALCYNLLQHTEDPQKIVDNLKNIVNEIRVFEWINVPADDLHLHILTTEKLNEWFGVEGIVEHIDMENCFSECWYAVIK